MKVPGIAATIWLVLGPVIGPAIAQVSPESAFQGQAEYDLAVAANKENNPQQKLDLLREWERKFPDSKLRGERFVMIAQADHRIAAIGLRPGSTPAERDAARKAATDLLDNIDRYLAPENQPARLNDDQWKLIRQRLEAEARSALHL